MSIEPASTLYFGVPSHSTDWVPRYLHKSVPFRFRSRRLQFGLSHGLFSSFDIDDGTRLLLKSLAGRLDSRPPESVLDVGCGVGVIGACLAAELPGARVLLQDRDALASAVAAENCRRNQLPNVEVACRLAFHGLRGRSFDLVTGNLPAKAGGPVLEALLRHAAGALAPGGTAAVVVVAPLAASIRRAIEAQGSVLLFIEETPSYAVFHFQGGAGRAEGDAQREDLSPYLRRKAWFSHRGRQYLLQTAYSLPEFDSISHATEIAMDLLAGLPPASRILLWNPGQGHVAALLALHGPPAARISLAARDGLESTITGFNLEEAGKPAESVQTSGSEAELADVEPAGAFDLLVAFPRPVPRVPWQPDLAEAARRTLRPGGLILAAGPSTEMRRFLDRSPGLQSRRGLRRAGDRAVLLARPEDPTPPSPGSPR